MNLKSFRKSIRKINRESRFIFFGFLFIPGVSFSFLSVILALIRSYKLKNLDIFFDLVMGVMDYFYMYIILLIVAGTVISILYFIVNYSIFKYKFNKSSQKHNDRSRSETPENNQSIR